MAEDEQWVKQPDREETEAPGAEVNNGSIESSIKSLLFLEHRASQNECSDPAANDFPTLQPPKPQRITPVHIASTNSHLAPVARPLSYVASSALEQHADGPDQSAYWTGVNDPMVAMQRPQAQAQPQAPAAKACTAWQADQQMHSMSGRTVENELQIELHGKRIGTGIATGRIEYIADALARVAALLSSSDKGVACAAAHAVAYAEPVLVSAGPNSLHALAASPVLQQTFADIAQRLEDRANMSMRSNSGSITAVSLPFRSAVEQNARMDGEDKSRRNNKESKLRDALHSCIADSRTGSISASKAARDFYSNVLCACLPSNVQWLANLFVTRAADAAARGGEADEDVAHVAGSADKVAKLSSRFNPDGGGRSAQLEGSNQHARGDHKIAPTAAGSKEEQVGFQDDAQRQKQQNYYKFELGKRPQKQRPPSPNKFAAASAPGKQPGPKQASRGHQSAITQVLTADCPSEVQTFAVLLELSDSQRFSKAVSRSLCTAIDHICNHESLGSAQSGTLEQQLRVLRCLGSLLGVCSTGVTPDDTESSSVAEGGALHKSLLDACMRDWEECVQLFAWQGELLRLAVYDAVLCEQEDFQRRLTEAHAVWRFARECAAKQPLAGALSFMIEGVFSHCYSNDDMHIARQHCQEAVSKAAKDSLPLYQQLLHHRSHLLEQRADMEVSRLSSRLLCACCRRLYDVVTPELRKRKAQSAQHQATTIKKPVRRAQPMPKGSIQNTLKRSFLSVNPVCD